MQDVKKDRNLYLGGSDIAAVMGISHFKTRWELLQEKAGIIENDFEGNKYTEYGNLIEPKIRQHINSVNNMSFEEHKIIKDFMRYHADGYDDKYNEVLEIKSTSQIHTDVSDYKYYLVQLLYGMKLYDSERGILAVYERPEDFSEVFNEKRLQVFIIEREKWNDLIEEITTAVTNFRNDWLLLKENPTLTEEDLTPFPVIANAQLVLELEEKLSAMKELENELKQAKSDLKNAMEQYSIKKWETPNGTKITLVPDGTDKTEMVFDEKTFKKENADLYAMYQTEKVKKGRAGYVKITLPKVGI